jgi:hypothetical protein
LNSVLQAGFFRVRPSLALHALRAPDALFSDNLPIVIGAVQSAPEIYEQIEGLGIDMQRLLRKLIL